MPMSMSASDWTRMQRRIGGMNYDRTVGIAPATNNFPKDEDINPPAFNRSQYGVALLIPADVGGSKIRRPASEFTNFTAARVADYVLKSQGQKGTNENAQNTGTAKLTVTRLAACRGCENLGITLPKVGICNKCDLAQRSRLN